MKKITNDVWKSCVNIILQTLNFYVEDTQRNYATVEIHFYTKSWKRPFNLLRSWMLTLPCFGPNWKLKTYLQMASCFRPVFNCYLVQTVKCMVVKCMVWKNCYIYHVLHVPQRTSNSFLCTAKRKIENERSCRKTWKSTRSLVSKFHLNKLGRGECAPFGLNWSIFLGQPKRIGKICQKTHTEIISFAGVNSGLHSNTGCDWNTLRLTVTFPAIQKI